MRHLLKWTASTVKWFCALTMRALNATVIKGMMYTDILFCSLHCTYNVFICMFKEYTEDETSEKKDDKNVKPLLFCVCVCVFFLRLLSFFHLPLNFPYQKTAYIHVAKIEPWKRKQEPKFDEWWMWLYQCGTKSAKKSLSVRKVKLDSIYSGNFTLIFLIRRSWLISSSLHANIFPTIFLKIDSHLFLFWFSSIFTQNSSFSPFTHISVGNVQFFCIFSSKWRESIATTTFSQNDVQQKRRVFAVYTNSELSCLMNTMLKLISSFGIYCFSFGFSLLNLCLIRTDVYK